MNLLINTFAIVFVFTMNFLQSSEENGWIQFQSAEWTIEFPANPEMTSKGDRFEQYVAVDVSNFPVAIYSLGIIKQKQPVDVENFINDIMRSDSDNNIIWHEIIQQGDVIIMDLIRTKKNSKMLQKEHFVITQNVVYQLMTLCYPIGAENHYYFINSFTTH